MDVEKEAGVKQGSILRHDASLSYGNRIEGPESAGHRNVDKRKAIRGTKGSFRASDSWVHALLQVCFSRRKFLSTLEHGFQCLRPMPQNLVIPVGSVEINSVLGPLRQDGN